MTEYAEGELFQILEDDGNLPESQVKPLTHDVVGYFSTYYNKNDKVL